MQERDGADMAEAGDIQPDTGEGALTRGQRAVRRLRGTATTDLTTDEIMELLRGE